MEARLSKQVAIVDIGETPVGKVPELGSLQLYGLAIKAALEDAGLHKEDIDGLLTAQSMAEHYSRQCLAVMEYLQLEVRYASTSLLGGASHCSQVGLAALLISSGVCETVVVAAADNILTGLSRDAAVREMAANRHPQYEIPYGVPVPTGYALVAKRHMHEYGTTGEQLAAVAMAMRKHAGLNPAAHKRDPITIDDVLKSRMISSPLHLLDCSLVSDGGAALILTSAERARELRKAPVYVHGFGEAYSHDNVSQAGSFTAFASRASGEQAFSMAGLSPKDVDVAMLYDSFTITVLIQLEDLGFCPKGEAGPFVQEGRIELNGALPVNPHGGLLSHAHPGYPGGIFHLTEAVRQLRGEAGPRQVADAEVALVNGIGGIFSSHATVLLGKAKP